MERRTPELGRELNRDFEKSLLQWQLSPEDPRAMEKVRNLLYTASDFAFGISFAIKGEAFKLSESRRAITPYDLKRFAKFDGKNFIFNLGPKKSQRPEYLLTTMTKMGQPHLIFWGRHDGMIGIFRPQEIDSISVR